MQPNFSFSVRLDSKYEREETSVIYTENKIKKLLLYFPIGIIY